MKFSVSVLLLSLLILFATTTFTQAVNGQPDVLLSQPMDSAAAVVEEEEIIEPEQIDVVHTSFQIIRPFTDNVTNRKRLSINEEAMNALEAYFKNNTDDDVIVVGVVGKVHCGKSYFLNELFKDARRFRVGPGVNPETQGIWMSVYPKNPAAGGKTVVALDTEGFFSSTTNDDYDAKMFAITTLLSSSLVYNTIKNIDQSQVDYLEILARKTSLFYLKQSSGNNAPFPRFYWIIRDYIYANDNSNTQKTKWLNKQLTERDRGTSLEESYGVKSSSNMLSEIFTSVDCLTLPIPDRTRAGLQHLGDKQNTNSEWVDALDAIRYRLFGDENVATGTGGELLGKIRMLVESVQQANNFPEVPSVWESLLSMQNQSAVAEAMNVFDAIMDKKVTPEHPMNEDEFSNALAGAEAVSKRVLRKLLFDIDSLYAKCLVQLKNVIDARMWVLKDRNNVNLKTYCNRERKAILERYKEMIQDIEIPINKNRLDEALERAEQEAVTGQGVFFDTCVKYRNDLMADINRARSDYVEANSKKIDAFLKGIGDKSIATYNVEFDLALSKIDLTKHSEKGATDAKWRLKLFTTQDFEKLAKELADTVVQSFRLKGAAYATESEYESQLQRVRREIALLEEEKHSAIKEKIEHAVTSVFNKEYDIYRSLANELKLPLPRKVMEEKNKEFKAKCERDIKDEIGDEIFSSEDELYASVVSKAKRNFVTMVETYWNDFTVRENEDMYSTNIAEPFRQAKTKVRDKCSKVSKGDYNGCVRKIIEKELRYTFASEELKNRAINEFIIKEDIVSMAPKKSNYAIVLTFLIGGLVIVFVFGLFVQEDSH